MSQAKHPHRVLKRFIETKVPPGTPNAVMAQTGTEKKKKKRPNLFTSILFIGRLLTASLSLSFATTNSI